MRQDAALAACGVTTMSVTSGKASNNASLNAEMTAEPIPRPIRSARPVVVDPCRLVEHLARRRQAALPVRVVTHEVALDDSDRLVGVEDDEHLRRLVTAESGQVLVVDLQRRRWVAPPPLDVLLREPGRHQR